MSNGAVSQDYAEASAALQHCSTVPLHTATKPRWNCPPSVTSCRSAEMSPLYLGRVEQRETSAKGGRASYGGGPRRFASLPKTVQPAFTHPWSHRIFARSSAPQRMLVLLLVCLSVPSLGTTARGFWPPGPHNPRGPYNPQGPNNPRGPYNPPANPWGPHDPRAPGGLTIKCRNGAGGEVPCAFPPQHYRHMVTTEGTEIE